MSYSITAATRTATGRRAKHVHDTGNVPAVVYGPGIAPISVQVGRSDFRKVYRAAGRSSLIDLALDASSPVKVLIQEVQVNPISMEPYHVDFRQIRMDEELEIEVAIKFIGESLAVKSLAGTLVHPITEIKVKCLPANLPHEIEVDLSVLKTFEDTITIGSLKMPAGVTVIDEASTTVATVVPPLTEEQLKKMEDDAKAMDVTAVKTEAEEKKAADAAKVAEEAAAAAAK